MLKTNQGSLSAKSPPVVVSGHSKALTVVSNQLAKYEVQEAKALEDYFDKEFPGVKGGKGKTSRGMNTAGLGAGKAAGKRILVRKPLPSGRAPLRLH